MKFEIENGVLKKCIPEDGETEAVIPSDVKSIGQLAFHPCDNLQHIVIPESVTDIGNGAFSDCNSLQSITIPNSVKIIRQFAFFQCNGLHHIVIPESIIFIGDLAFSNCQSLQSVTLPNTIIKFGQGPFFRCSGLQRLNIPDGMECLDCYSFNDYRHLTEIAVTERNPYYCTENSVLFSKDRTQLIRYPAGKNASEYVIPDSVTSISDWAFYGCENLQCIIIPDSVKHFGSGAFLECSNLRKVVYGTAVIYTAGYNIARLPNDLQNACEVLQTGDYRACKADFTGRVKYAVLFADWCRHPSRELTRFIQKHLFRMLPVLFEANNVSQVQELLEQGRFIKTAPMMEKAIDLAVQHTQKGGSPEIQMYLMRYQKTHFPREEKQI